MATTLERRSASINLKTVNDIKENYFYHFMKSTIHFLALLCFFGCNSKNSLITGHEGKYIPPFKILLSDSTTYFNPQDIPTGRSIVFFYYGANCSYSKSQMEEIIENINILKDVQFYIFTPYPYSEMRQFNETYHLDQYLNIKTGVDFENSFGAYFEIPGVPYMAIYGRDKKLIEAFIGKVYAKKIKQVADK